MTTTHPTFTTGPPPPQTFAHISFPHPAILLVTFNRPRHLNCINTAANHELDALFTWYDSEPTLRCAVVTGAGRAFCAGADLHEWNARNRNGRKPPAFPPSGFGGLSRRAGKKPVVGAVNGPALGGGMEIVANLDLVVAAAAAAVFALPEAERGVAALEGSLPRLARSVGRQRAMEMALTARRVGAAEAARWGFVNEVVEDDDDEDEEGDVGADGVLGRRVVRRALEVARAVAEKSPDSVIVSRAGVVSGWGAGSAEEATRVVKEVWEARLNAGENLREGVRAFAEKRRPRWADSRL